MTPGIPGATGREMSASATPHPRDDYVFYYWDSVSFLLEETYFFHDTGTQCCSTSFWKKLKNHVDDLEESEIIAETVSTTLAVTY